MAAKLGFDEGVDRFAARTEIQLAPLELRHKQCLSLNLGEQHR